MQTITSVHEMQSLAIRQRSGGKLIALVPTMGALHAGHESLIEIAKEKGDFVVVSIFVNPRQFGPNEDFETYPRRWEEDLATCERLGVDVVFAPAAEEIYPPHYSVYVEENWISRDLCGVSRPHHFRGVVTICVKLFNLVRPDFAVFGAKDAQQCAIIRKTVEDLHLPVEVVVGPTVREEDGLAVSSRNQYLTTEQRGHAASIYRALSIGRQLTLDGVRNVDRVIAEVTHHLSQSRRVRLIYAAIVDRDFMQPVREIEPGKCLIMVACWVDEVRLIDNVEL